jgi:hypothetical protein
MPTAAPLSFLLFPDRTGAVSPIPISAPLKDYPIWRFADTRRLFPSKKTTQIIFYSYNASYALKVGCFAGKSVKDRLFII